MNSSELWANHEYAWIPQRGRGQSYSTYVKRVRVLSVKKVVQSGNERRTAMCTFEELDWDGNKLYLEPVYHTEPAREIVDFWDNFWSEHEEHLEGVKKHKLEAARKEREAEEERRALISDLVAVGIPEEAIQLGQTFGNYVRIERKALVEWLQSKKESTIDNNPREYN